MLVPQFWFLTDVLTSMYVAVNVARTPTVLRVMIDLSHVL